MTNIVEQPLTQGQITLNNASVASIVYEFTNFDHWSTRHYSTWDDLYKYCTWTFEVNNTIYPSRRVSSVQELGGSVLPPMLTASGGGLYTGSVAFSLSIKVDRDDTFPKLRRCRNSLVASARGQKNYCRHPSQSGINTKFNDPLYYNNFYNNTGRLFVQHYTGIDPGSNNDGVVWWPRKRKTKFGWPKINSNLELTGPGRRGACYDTNLNTYVTTVPAGSWDIRAPFLWTEPNKNGTLFIEDLNATEDNKVALLGPTAIVFPVTQGDYVAFLVHAHGMDSFMTDYIDPSAYELVVRIRYRNDFGYKYTTLTPQQSDLDINGPHKSLFNLFDGGSTPIYAIPSAQAIDNNKLPTKIDICRRNLVTGIHSPWVPLAVLKRRLPNAALRLDPVFKSMKS